MKITFVRFATLIITVVIVTVFYVLLHSLKVPKTFKIFKDSPTRKTYLRLNIVCLLFNFAVLQTIIIILAIYLVIAHETSKERQTPTPIAET